MNAQKALELGFCDEVLYQPIKNESLANGFTFSRRALTNSLMDKLRACIPKEPPDPPPDEKISLEPTTRVNASDLEKRLARFQFA